MNAHFTLPKHEEFVFHLDGVDGEFTLPAIGTLTSEQAFTIARTQLPETSVKEKHELMKGFLLEFCPELEEKGLGENDWNLIFGFYVQNQNARFVGK